MVWRMIGRRLLGGALVLLAVTLLIFAAIEALGTATGPASMWRAARPLA